MYLISNINPTARPVVTPLYDSLLQKAYANFLIKKWEKRNSNGWQFINSRMLIRRERKKSLLFIHLYVNSVNSTENNVIITVFYQLSWQQKIEVSVEISDPKLYFEIKDVDLIAKSLVIILNHAIWSLLNVWRLRKNEKKTLWKTKGIKRQLKNMLKKKLLDKMMQFQWQFSMSYMVRKFGTVAVATL